MKAERSDLSTSQGTPRIAKSHQRIGRGIERSSSRTFGGRKALLKNRALGLLVSRSVREYIFYCLKPQSLWSFFWPLIRDSYMGKCPHGSKDYADSLTRMTLPVPLSFIHPNASFAWL